MCLISFLLCEILRIVYLLSIGLEHSGANLVFGIRNNRISECSIAVGVMDSGWGVGVMSRCGVSQESGIDKEFEFWPTRHCVAENCQQARGNKVFYMGSIYLWGVIISSNGCRRQGGGQRRTLFFWGGKNSTGGMCVKPAH